MGELGLGAFLDVGFQGLPLALGVADCLAVGADGLQTAQYLPLGLGLPAGLLLVLAHGYLAVELLVQTLEFFEGVILLAGVLAVWVRRTIIVLGLG
jgi:hypothetical protein